MTIAGKGFILNTGAMDREAEVIEARKTCREVPFYIPTRTDVLFRCAFSGQTQAQCMGNVIDNPSSTNAALSCHCNFDQATPAFPSVSTSPSSELKLKPTTFMFFAIETLGRLLRLTRPLARLPYSMQL